jgi:hypothetical protein
MRANGNGNGGYDAEVWNQIKAEWLAGQLSLSDISRNYGPSRATIRAKAKRFEWPPRGSLAGEVRKEIQSQLLDEKGAPAGAPPLQADEIIDSAAARGVAVVRKHRKLLSELLGAVDVALAELKTMEIIKQDVLERKRLKGRIQMITALSRSRIDTLKVASQVLSQAIPLERKAYSLDSDRGETMSIRYVVPDIQKPAWSGLSEDEWDKKSYPSTSHGARHNWHKRVG